MAKNNIDFGTIIMWLAYIALVSPFFGINFFTNEIVSGISWGAGIGVVGIIMAISMMKK